MAKASPEAADVPTRAGRRRAVAIVAASGLALALSGCAAPEPAATPDHADLDPLVPVPAGGRIEVIEFYWFGCPHCADMHPRVTAWRAGLGSDVAFRMEPAVLGERWEAGARLHHVLARLGVLDRLAGSVFEAVQGDLLDLADEGAVLGWARGEGLEPTRFVEAWRSAAVADAVGASKATSARYRLRGVPTFVVDGRRFTSNALSGSASQTLVVVDRLVEQARRDRRAAG